MTIMFLLIVGAHYEGTNVVGLFANAKDAIDAAPKAVGACDDYATVLAMPVGGGKGSPVASWSTHYPLVEYPCDGEGPPYAPEGFEMAITRTL